MELRGYCEVTLLDIGGKELLDDARAEATTFADLYHPWDGVGVPPTARLEAWWYVMGARVQKALSERDIPDRCGCQVEDTG
ncbi:hypothetical protein EV383_5695 [Pseudonocardia sediminis]|uniref:Uncharacterized protein n=1 Tax=Pseudonocardia sediminis TaxID=1397368 RepID=A0A4V2FRJ4_PSEST|nr:hypothetical protein [Pseudonocardia sediminis]RZT88750.1 hypothetical protein EV383_5695 [Pseudonocardia sediminis]